MTAFSFPAIRRAAALALASLAGAATAADLEQWLRHGQQLRSYVLHLPGGTAGTDAAPRPLVMVLHGGGGNAANAARMSGMSDIADRESFIVVYPNGSGSLKNALLTWNAGNCCGTARDGQIDDVGFLNAVIDHASRRAPVDPRRIYVAGMSNGGMMAYRLGCETPGRFAAIAPVAGAMNVDCRPAVPLSVIAFHGTADEHVLYEGGPPLKSRDSVPRVDTPVVDTIAFWAAHNGCRARTQSQAAEVRSERFEFCAGDTEVVLHTLDGFGHAWPGGERGSPWGDDPAASIDASETMWAFFRRHRR